MNVKLKYNMKDYVGPDTIFTIGEKEYAKSQESKVAADPVNHPPHYNQGDIEAIDAIQSALGDEAFGQYCRGQVFKYMWRMHLKGKPKEDAAKALFYLNKLIGVL